ncbi:MAG: aminotransferase class V-fold PLP-dependent enzyme [Cyclobacteriaceae bacterium]|nr:aminotransferase class V-fold PLP-dependent enzyme [Cyclobacteriaceae bacterium]
MTSRRSFIQKTGLLTGATLLHGITEAMPQAPVSLGEDIRSQLLVPEGKIYLNTGSLGPSPRAVLDTVVNAMWTLEKDPVSENWGRLGTEMEGVRKKVGDFIHAEPSEVLLTRNTTEGLNLICQVLPLEKDDEIITTTLEHGGGEVGLEFLELTKGARIKKVTLPLPPEREDEIVSAVVNAMTPRTKLVMLSHVNTVTGMVMPLAEIAKVTSARGIFLMVDGAQAPGLIPIDVKAIGADAYASSGHKWLLGPKETGFLYIRKGFPSRVPPVFTLSGLDAYSKSSGTRNVATMMGLGAAIDWHTALNPAQSAAYCMDLRKYCDAGLRKMNGLRMLSPENPKLATGIVSFELNNVKNTDVYASLREKNIIVKVLPQHNAIRISCHIFVSKANIDGLLKALQPLLS